MKLRTLPVLIVLAFATVCRAQDSSRISPAMNKIFIEPMALADFFNGPSFRAGGEIGLGYRWSVIGTGGIYTRGYYLKGGIKAYIDKASYVELSFMRKNTWHTVNDVVEINDSTGNSTGKGGPAVDYVSHQDIWGIHAEYGYEAVLWRNLVVEVYGGVGAKLRTVNITISDSLQQSLQDYQQGDVANLSDSRVNKLARFSLVGGVRIGYCYRRRRR